VPRVAEIMRADWRAIAGDAPAVDLAGDACPACGCTQPLVGGACRDCGLQLE
jgi:hypothetical protein